MMLSFVLFKFVFDLHNRWKLELKQKIKKHVVFGWIQNLVFRLCKVQLKKVINNVNFFAQHWKKKLEMMIFLFSTNHFLVFVKKNLMIKLDPVDILNNEQHFFQCKIIADGHQDIINEFVFNLQLFSKQNIFRANISRDTNMNNSKSCQQNTKLSKFRSLQHSLSFDDVQSKYCEKRESWLILSLNFFFLTVKINKIERRP